MFKKAFTIPVIVSDYKNKEIKSLLNKNYSVIEQALRFYYLDYGVVSVGQDFESRTFKEVF